MNEQVLTAFHRFDSALSDAISTLHQELQETNTLHSCSMYADEFNDIIKFSQKSKAFTRFLQEGSDYIKCQYSKFQNKISHNISINNSSQISIQSSPQSVNDWSYNANDGSSAAQDTQTWRGYDIVDNNDNDTDYIFNDGDINIDMVPIITPYHVKLIDTDNDSDCTEINSVPSLPPSVIIQNGDENNDENDDEIEYKYDVADGAEDDEKWDDPLIKTRAFMGFFETAPTEQVDFKRDEILKPPPPKWQEREEENKQLINTLNDNFDTKQPENDNHNDLDVDNKSDSTVLISKDIEAESVPNVPKFVDIAGAATATTINAIDADTPIINDIIINDNNMHSMQRMPCNRKRRERESIDIISESDTDDVLLPINFMPFNNNNNNMSLSNLRDSSKSQHHRHDDDGKQRENISMLSNNEKQVHSTNNIWRERKGEPVPFKQYEGSKDEYHDIQQHPHYHPLIHGKQSLDDSDELHDELDDDEGKDIEETAINGENQRFLNANNNNFATSHQHHIDGHNEIKQHSEVENHENVHFMNNGHQSHAQQQHFNGNVFNHQHINNEPFDSSEIVTLRHALDYHFEVNHNDFSDIKQALNSWRDQKNENNHYHHVHHHHYHRNQRENVKKKRKLPNLSNIKRK